MGYRITGNMEFVFDNISEKEKLDAYIRNEGLGNDFNDYCDSELGFWYNFSHDGTDFFGIDADYHDQEYKLAELLKKASVRCEYCINYRGENGERWCINGKDSEITPEDYVFISKLNAKQLYESLSSEQKNDLFELLKGDKERSKKKSQVERD